jgi:hypothetical protein
LYFCTSKASNTGTAAACASSSALVCSLGNAGSRQA